MPKRDATAQEQADQNQHTQGTGGIGRDHSMISKDLLGCSTARNKGTCDNRVNIRRDALEASILNGLKKHLMEPELFKEFCAEFTKEVNRLRMERGANLEVARRDLDRTTRELDKAIDAILQGVPPLTLKDKITQLEARKAELTEKLANSNEPPPLLHPNMAALYAQRIAALSENLQREDTRAQAAEILRSLVDQVTLVPEDGELVIVLRGDLGAILRFATGKKDPDFLSEAEALDNLLAQSGGSRKPGRRNAKTSALNATEVSQLSLVAGAGSNLHLLPEQVKMVAGTGVDHNLQSTPVKMVAGARTHLCLLFRTAA